MHHQIDGFDAIAETRDLRFLSNAAAARQPVQQPKSRRAYAARGRYAVLGFIYYGCILLEFVSPKIIFCKVCKIWYTKFTHCGLLLTCT